MNIIIFIIIIIYKNISVLNQMSAGIDPREVENPSATHVMDDAAQGAVVSGEQTVLAVPDNAYIITTNQELGSERTEQTGSQRRGETPYPPFIDTQFQFHSYLPVSICLIFLN